MPDGDLSKQYWAAKKDPDDPDAVVGELRAHENVWWQAGMQSGYWPLLRLIYAQAQGMDPRGGQRNSNARLTFTGPAAKAVRFRIQLTRGYIKQRNTMAQGERPSFQCLALNDDFASMAQVPMAQTALDYLYRKANGEQCEWSALESDGYFGEGFIWGRWDFSAGNDVPHQTEEPAIDPQTKQPLINPTNGQPVMKPVTKMKKSGAPKLVSLFPWEVVREANAKESIWCIVREVASKFEIAARFPDLAEKILGTSETMRSEAGLAEMFGYTSAATTTDQIIVRHFYHQSCDAVPGGRYVGYVGNTVLWDVPCPLPEGMPVISVCSAKYFATTFGYPESTDLLGPQEMIDELLTAFANNALRFGRQSLYAEEGVDVDLPKIAQGGAFFRMKQGQKPPQVIDWGQMPESIKWGLEFLLERLNDISGMNATVRGAPSANITSGAFAALMVNVAQKFVSATEATVDFSRNATANMILQLTRANADGPFMVEVTGVNQEPYMRLMTTQDLSGIVRVLATTSNPLLRTIPGRFEMWGAIKDIVNPKERQAAIQLISTGNADGFTDDSLSTTLLIQWENEQLMKGLWCEPAASDHPGLHNEGHKAALDKIRTMPNVDPAIITNLQNHMSAHALVWAQNDATYCLTCNIPVPPEIGIDPVTGLPKPMPQAQPAANGGGPAANGGGGGTGKPGTGAPSKLGDKPEVPAPAQAAVAPKSAVSPGPEMTANA